LIENALQYKITRYWARRFRQSVRDLESYEPDQWTPIFIASYTGQAQELEEQCDEYLEHSHTQDSDYEAWKPSNAE
jgi:Cft2 family RNA processing exonuclease